MGAVGQVILTVQGSYALADTQATGKNVQPKYYKVSNQDIQLDPTLTDITGVWKTADISGYIPIDNDTVEFVIDIPPEQATDYGRTFGLYLADGTLFAVAKPPYPFPPALRQTFRVQVRYSNINQITDFKYIPFYETEQSMSILDVPLSLGDRILIARQELEDLKRAKDVLFANDREFRTRIEKLEQEVRTLEENQVALATSLYNLAYYVLRNTQEIERLKGGS